MHINLTIVSKFSEESLLQKLRLGLLSGLWHFVPLLLLVSMGAVGWCTLVVCFHRLPTELSSSSLCTAAVHGVQHYALLYSQSHHF